MSFNVNYIANKSLNVETKEDTLAIDVQGIDKGNIESRGEYLPTKEVNSGVEVTELVKDLELRGRVTEIIEIYYRDINKYTDFDFLVTNRLDVELRIAIRLNGSAISVVMEDGSIELMHSASDNAHYKIPPNTRSVPLSSLKPVLNDKKAHNDWGIKKLYPYNNISLYISDVNASSGEVSINMVGKY